MCCTYERRYRDKIQAALLDWARTSARGGRVLSPRVAAAPSASATQPCESQPCGLRALAKDGTKPAAQPPPPVPTARFQSLVHDGDLMARGHRSAPGGAQACP